MSGRACGPFIGFGVLLLTIFLVVLGALWFLRARGDDRARALARSLLDAALVAWVGVLLILALAPVAIGTGNPWNLVPFGELIDSIGRGGIDLRNALFDVAVNVAAFVPLGLLVGLRFDAVSLPVWIATIICLTVGIEVIQSVALGRSGDVTDVITNCAGSIFGFSVGRMARRGTKAWRTRDIARR